MIYITANQKKIYCLVKKGFKPFRQVANDYFFAIGKQELQDALLSYEASYLIFNKL